jgi:hypothetical protein
MKLKRYKREIFNEYVKKLLSYKGRNIFDTYHSIEQFNDRFPDYDYEDWKEVCRNGIDKIIDIFKDSSKKYIIISKSTDIAIQMEWRKDKKSNDNKNHGFTATTLDYVTQKKATQNDTKLFVEEIKKYNLEKWFETSDYKEMIEKIGYLGIKIINECPEYEIYIKEEAILRNFEIVEVE